MADMRAEDAANGFSALGNVSRLRIFRLLVQAGRQGLPISRIHEHLEIPLSTLAHHLDALVRAGLVVQHRNGRQVICCASFEHMDDLVAYLNENCCAGVAGSGSQPAPVSRKEEPVRT
jgi:DNA-binding transcriptional ArsR family regulator